MTEGDHHDPVNEYEREPVPEKALLGLKNYVGQFAGEHVAGTELMIGPLFLASGVSAFDFIFGLLLGNLLAVLSWTFFTAPIATRARLTLYFQLEKICGRRLVLLYNLANGVMFTVLAGAMMTVSATALGVYFKFSMPQLTDTLPTGAGWVVAVLITGVLFSTVAAYGYRFVSRFANIAAPWMVLVFVAFGIIGLRQMGLTSVGDFWRVASTVIWTGGEPQPGQIKFTFWHVMFFAWFCNMAWHIGMADLSVFRYARKSWYGLASAAGMYIGHFMAWIAASVLYAVQLHQDPTNTAVLPGPLAYRACGLAGLLAVVAAGWTTANPTLYRAGLAFQSLIPRVLPLQGHAGHRPHRQRDRNLPHRYHAAAGFCGALGNDPDANGRGDLHGFLGAPEAWAALQLCRGRWHSVQLGCWPGLVAYHRRVHRPRNNRAHANLLRQPARLVHHLPRLRGLSRLLQGRAMHTSCRLSHETSRTDHILPRAGGHSPAGGVILRRQAGIAHSPALDAGGGLGLVRRHATLDGTQGDRLRQAGQVGGKLEAATPPALTGRAVKSASRPRR